jgi:hypothetical protein
MTEQTQLSHRLCRCHDPASGYPVSAYMDSRFRGNDKFANLNKPKFRQTKPKANRNPPHKPAIRPIFLDCTTSFMVNARSEPVQTPSGPAIVPQINWHVSGRHALQLAHILPPFGWATSVWIPACAGRTLQLGLCSVGLSGVEARTQRDIDKA